MTSLQRPGQIITFYSYKGGTGRTMALANLACLLAQQNDVVKPVLAIDWDLEAPGLHLYFRDLLTKGTKDPKKVEAKLNDGNGLIDLLIEIREKIEGSGPPGVESGREQTEEEAGELLERTEIERFVLPTDVPRLHLLKAGRFDGDYPRRVNMFNWEGLYNHSPWLFQSLAELLTNRYEYVLIDSRTGRTDTSNICTMLLPQKLVVVFTPNRQSLTGVEELVKQATAYRRKSDDIRPLLVYPLPSRIENSEPKRREQWRFGDAKENIDGYQTTFEKIFAEVYALPQCDLAEYFDAVQVQHVPPYSYGEELAVLTERGTDISSIHFRFKTFCDWLVSGAAPWEAPKDAGKKEKELAKQLEMEREKSIALRRRLRNLGAAILGVALTVGSVIGVQRYREYIKNKTEPTKTMEKANPQNETAGQSTTDNVAPPDWAKAPPRNAWCYQEKAWSASPKYGLNSGFGAYCHYSERNCEKARSGSPTASECAHLTNINPKAWNGRPMREGYLHSWYRLNLTVPLGPPFPIRPSWKAQLNLNPEPKLNSTVPS